MLAIDVVFGYKRAFVPHDVIQRRISDYAIGQNVRYDAVIIQRGDSDGEKQRERDKMPMRRQNPRRRTRAGMRGDSSKDSIHCRGRQTPIRLVAMVRLALRGKFAKG